MDTEINRNYFICELLTLTNELLKRRDRRLQEGVPERTRFVEAQIVIWTPIMERFMLNVEAKELVEAMQDECEHQRSVYDNARWEEDRDMSILSLARIRTISTLLRRLQSPDRYSLFQYDSHPRVIN